MEILKVVSLLLAYPEQSTFDSFVVMKEVIETDCNLDTAMKQRLKSFIDALSDKDLLDAQEDYLSIFGRGSSTSLLLFEHVHGQSRDRGQAMVDLLERYEQHGFELSAKELPDFLPLFLEFLAHSDKNQAIEWLNEVNHILAILEERLQQRGSEFSQLFSVLLSLVDVVEDRNSLKEKVAAEAADHTAEAMDKVWEEEAVKFAATDAGCSQGGPNQNTESYSQDINIQWMDAAKAKPSPSSSANQSSQNQVVGE